MQNKTIFLLAFALGVEATKRWQLCCLTFASAMLKQVWALHSALGQSEGRLSTAFGPLNGKIAE